MADYEFLRQKYLTEIDELRKGLRTENITQDDFDEWMKISNFEGRLFMLALVMDK